MTALVLLPVLIPLAAMLCSIFTMQQGGRKQAVSLAGGGALFIAALVLFRRVLTQGALEMTLGGWPAPYGILFRVDALSSVMVLVTAIMALATLVYMISPVEGHPRHPLTLPLMHGALAGVCGAFCTADLFNLYVWYEVMLVCALGLLALGGRIMQLDAVYKYFAPNLLGTLMLLIAVGLIYAATGHLQFDALRQASAALPDVVLTTLLAALLLALLVKSAAFPLYAWLPAAYPALPVPVMAFFAGLFTKVGTYAILRMGGDVFAPSPHMLLEGLGWLAVATMIAGVLGAAYHWDLRRILSFHIISQIGYILLAIALGGLAEDSASKAALNANDGYRAALFYTVHHIIVKANLFFLAGLVFRQAGSFDLRRVGGLASSSPLLALIFAVPALSLVGIPPLSGFWAKLLVIQTALAQERMLWAAAALGVSALTLYSMLKVWMEAFWKPHPQAKPREAANHSLTPAWLATGALAAITLLLGLFPQPFLAVSAQAVRFARLMAGSP